jgi:multidrug efflux pump subunit AcrA (membrane-fusion protein)
MNRSEKGWLATGLVMGAIIVAAIFIGRQYIVSRRAPEAVTVTPVSAAPEAVRYTTPNSDSAASVELSDDEQKAIGVETVEVKRQTIHKEIIAPGKVAESETGIGTISARIGGRIDKLLLNVTGRFNLQSRSLHRR